MEHSLIFYLIMLLGFINGIIVSLFIFIKAKPGLFIKLAALGVFLFSLSILREFLYVFGDDIELDFYLENFLFFKLVTVGVLILAYDKALLLHKNNFLVWLPGLIEFIILSVVSLGLAFWSKNISDALFIAVDCISFFWMLYAYKTRGKYKRKNKENLKFLFLFVLGFMLIFFTRVIQFVAILFELDWLYEFHFLFRVIAIGIVVYMLSIYLIISFSKSVNRKTRTESLLKPKNKEFLNKLKASQ